MAAILLAVLPNAAAWRAAWSSNNAYLRLDAQLNRAGHPVSLQTANLAEDWSPLPAAGSARFVAAYGLGLTDMLMQRYSAALTAFQAALAANPQYSGTHAWLGDAEHALGNDDQAVPEWQAAQALPLLLARGDASGQAGDWPAAISWYGLATQVDPGSAAAFRQLGQAYGAAGRPAAQIEALRMAVRLSPDDIQIRHSLGLAYLQQGDLTDAAIQFTVVLAVEPNDFYTNLYMANLELSLGNLDAAEASARKTIEDSPANPRTHFSLGSVLARRAQWPAAIAELQSAVALIEPWNRQSNTPLTQDDQISYQLLLAQTCRSGGQPALAIAAYRAVLKLDPHHAAAAAALAALQIPGQP